MDLTLARGLIKSAVDSNKKFTEEAKVGIAYYENDNDIIKTGAAAINEVNNFLKVLGKHPLKSADNRIPTNWHKIFTDQKIGYLFTYPPQFACKEDEKLAAKIKEALGADYEMVIKQVGLDATNTGRGWLHYWYNKGEPFEYYFISPLEVVPIYDNTTVKKKLKYLLRYYLFTDEQGNEKTRYEIWDNKKVAYLEKKKEQSSDIEFESLEGSVNIQNHSYGEIPFIEFRNNGGCTNDLKMYKKLIDAVDKLISGFANDIDDIQEILWVIKNYAGEMSQTEIAEDGTEVVKEVDFKQKLKAQKYVFVDENGGVETLQNEVPYEARGRFLDILIQQLYVSAMAVNPNPDKAGNQTGIYIEFLYSLLELKAGLMETEFRSSLNKLVNAILKHIGQENAEVEQIWTRNKPRNETEISDIIAQTPSTVMSDQTKTKVHPLVEDWQEEVKQIAKEEQERQQNMLDQYPPNTPPGGDE